MGIALVTNQKTAPTNTMTLCEQIQLMKINGIQEKWEIGKTAPANMISLLEQIQPVKMASRRNEKLKKQLPQI